MTINQGSPIITRADDTGGTATIGPLSPPPGASLLGEHVTIMLELAQGEDKTAAQQAATQAGAQLLYETQLIYSGIAVSIESSNVGRLSNIPGVRAVHLLPAKQRLRTRSSPLNMLASIAQRSDLTGQGVRIGVVDSGIDYTHAQFGGPGTLSAFDANNPAIIESGTFPTSKVVAGQDFVGDDYDAEGLVGSATPQADPDPLDCRVPDASVTLNRGGHGTHVAATAAGYGLQGGLPFLGPYTSSLDLASFDVAPGVAPEASLVALKVFGCRGSTAFLTRAIEYALDPNGDGNQSDRLVDVLLLSLGSPFGSDDDPDALAVNRAVEAGVVVVAAVGDTANVFYSVSTPGSASGAITVGATDTSLAITTIAAFSSRGPQRGNEAVKPDLVAPGVGILSAAAGTGLVTTPMDGTSSAAAAVAGAAALVLEKHATWAPVQVKAALIGTADPLESLDGTLYPVSQGGAGQLNHAALGKLENLGFCARPPL
jgi:subtilisin family serine protease